MSAGSEMQTRGQLLARRSGDGIGGAAEDGAARQCDAEAMPRKSERSGPKLMMPNWRWSSCIAVSKLRAS
eukprot:4486017-Pleurochrysis_carterae.AAC.1